MEPISRVDSKKATKTKTPFDYWLTQNKIIITDFSNNGVTSDEWSGTVSKKVVKKQSQHKQLKYYDEHFREVNPDLRSYVSSPEMSSTITAANEIFPTLKTSRSSIELSKNSDEDRQNSIKIRLIKQDSYNKQLTQRLSFDFSRNALYIFPETCSEIEEHVVPKCLRESGHQEGLLLYSRNTCHTSNNLPYLNAHQFKFLCKANMSEHNRFVPPEQIYERVVDWLSSNDFQKQESDNTKSSAENEFETNLPDNQSDITSITKVIIREERKKLEKALEEIEEVPKTISDKTVVTQDSSDARLQAVVDKLKNNVMVNSLKKITNLTSWQLYNKRLQSCSKPPSIPAILENEEVVCFPLYTFTFLFFIYLLFTNYKEYLIYFLFCPY